MIIDSEPSPRLPALSATHKPASRWLLAAILCALPPSSIASDWLEPVDQALHLESPNGLVRADLSGLADIEGYYIDQRPPGLIFGDDEAFVDPRLSLFLDTQLGPHLNSLVQVRFDRGFDPRSKTRDARFDEYLLRYTPFGDTRLSLQAGKFATVFGQWVQRHDSWKNPFVNAPLPYENVTIITDYSVPAAPPGFLRRRDVPDRKSIWVPVIWGPSYATGGALLGAVGNYDYAIEVKNAGLSSRPYAWDATELGWENPAVTGRVGHRPNAAWNLGVSASWGAYLLPEARATLPAGKDIGDYAQLTVGSDISYAWRHWQFWAEAMASRFEVPNVGDAETVTYFIEARYKFTPHFFGALRWNQQLFDKVPDGFGGWQRWDRDAWRIDAALSYRFTRHIQCKLQYSYGRQNGSFQQGEQLVAGQVTLKF